jgi:hypothetical protein
MARIEVDPHTLLQQVGVTMFGGSNGNWQKRMAQSLAVNNDTVRHWCSGKSKLPPFDHKLWGEVQELIEEQAKALQMLARYLKKQRKPK